MGIKQWKYGDLNPANHPQSGRSLEPESFTGLGNLAEAARRINTPSFVEKLGFPLKGIIIRVEEGNESDEGWGSWAFSSREGKPVLHRCRVRIPELHAHLPIPETFGPLGDKRVMALYPVFQAKEQNVTPPIVGEICYIDFGDRKRFEDPIYLGMLKGAGTPSEGAAATDSNGSSASNASNSNDNPLNSTAPPGDPIGQSEELDPNGQSSVETPPVPNASDIICKNTRNPTSGINKPSCHPFVDRGPGMYETFVRGNSTGFQQMDEWKNRNGSKILVLAASKHTLQLMEAAFLRDNPDLGAEFKKFINSGYRNVELQACARAKYDACKKEWKRKGGRFKRRDPYDPGALLDEQPSPVARPGFSKHNSGVATDFNADGTNRSRKTRTTRLWIWLQTHAREFGWFNPSWATNNPAEPWHFEFSETLARSMGVFPRENSEQTPVR